MIDLSLCSLQIRNFFEWPIDSDFHHSDHYQVKVNTTFDYGGDGVTKLIPRWNLKNASLEKFQYFCEINHELFHPPEQGIAFLTDTILAAANASIPITSQSTRRKPVP